MSTKKTIKKPTAAKRKPISSKKPTIKRSIVKKTTKKAILKKMSKPKKQSTKFGLYFKACA